MRGISVLGTGLRTMSYEREPPDEVILTSWVTLFFVPIIPIGRKKCRYVCDSAHFVEIEFRPHFEVIEELPMSMTSVITTYLGAMISLTVTLTPLAYMIWRIQRRAATPVESVLFYLCATWPVVCVALKERRDRQFLEPTWSEQRSDLNPLAQRGNTAHRIAIWRTTHVFPQWLYAVVTVVALLPGFALGWRNGWGQHAIKIVAVASLCFALGVTTMIDRAIFRRRQRSQLGQSGGETPAIEADED